MRLRTVELTDTQNVETEALLNTFVDQLVRQAVEADMTGQGQNSHALSQTNTPLEADMTGQGQNSHALSQTNTPLEADMQQTNTPLVQVMR